MHSFSETRILPYTPDQLFALVLDIEKYPEFLPWCRAARILAREEPGAFMGELIISFSHITERYTSRISALVPSVNANRDGCIDVTLVSGPFKYLENHWRFLSHPEGCEIQLALTFAFKSRILDSLIGSLFERASRKMVSAFTARAEALYGQRPLQ